ncbi:MAG: copper amine oxidase N-terminal domain-containing protein, partial [Defluviitaleaceae bacterium]|nr:copper amine oxidase N-terminal domain-containing protein [Defluviitaleaceae bacterium]
PCPNCGNYPCTCPTATLPGGGGGGDFPSSRPELPPLQPRPPVVRPDSDEIDELTRDDDEPGDEVDDFRYFLLQVDSQYILCGTTGNLLFIMDVAPVIVDGRTLVPLRFIANMLGAVIHWDDATRQVTIVYDGRVLTFAIGEMAPGMDVPAQIIDGRTMVPLRFISEFFGAEVNWNEETRTIEVSTPSVR